MSTALTLSPSSIERADVAPSEKGALMRFYSKLKGGSGQALSRAKVHVTEGGAAIRQGGESAVIGALLGAVEAQYGSLDYKKVPIDGALAAVGLLGAVALAHEPVAVDLRNAGSGALAVFAYRQTSRYIKAKKVGMHGDLDESDWGAEDPIMEAAKHL